MRGSPTGDVHHNGLSLRCAQIGRVPRGTSHLWDRERLSAETLALLAADGEDIARHVITDYAPLSEAPQTLIRLATGTTAFNLCSLEREGLDWHLILNGRL